MIHTPLKLLKAINQVETGGREGAIYGDNGKALGPLQIHFHYWKDSGISGAYKFCATFDYSCQVFNAYMNRFALKYLQENNLEALARIHNGGPDGYHNPNTLAYWKKVEKVLNK
jgi:hypothetical protein